MSKEEKTTAAMAAAVAVFFAAVAWLGAAPLWPTLSNGVLALGLVPVAVADARELRIPNRMLLVLLALWLALTAAVAALALAGSSGAPRLLPLCRDSLLGLLLGGGVFLLARLVFRQGVGMGDIKLFGVIGLYVGLSGIFSVMMLSLLACALAGIILILGKKKGRKDCLPMAPFALAGVLLYQLALL